MKKMASNNIAKLKVFNKKVKMNGALEVPSGWELCTAIEVATMHDFVYCVAVVTHFALQSRETNRVEFLAFGFGESSVGKEIAEFRVEINGCHKGVFSGGESGMLHILKDRTKMFWRLLLVDLHFDRWEKSKCPVFRVWKRVRSVEWSRFFEGCC